MYTSFVQALAHTLLAATRADGRWQPGIGDPTPLGWATTIAFLVAALICFRTFLTTRAIASVLPGSKARPFFWLALAAMLLFLGINKQLDLQTWFTQVGKDAAKTQGWYGQRRVYQRYFIYGIAAGGVVMVGACFLLVRGAAYEHLLAVAGMGFLLGFVVIRAASLHHVDTLLRLHVGALRLNHLLENGGTVCVAIAAWRAHGGAVRAEDPGGT